MEDAKSQDAKAPIIDEKDETRLQRRERLRKEKAERGGKDVEPEGQYGEFFDLWESEEEYEHSTFHFHGYDVKLEHLGAHLENTYLIGQMVWPDAEVLCHYISLHKHLFEGKTVLDLGAGPGLAGFFVAKFAKRVVITDLEDKVIQLLQKNADALGHDGNIQVAKLAWGVGVEEFLKEYGPFDIVMGSGIVYDSDFVAALIETVAATLAPFKNVPHDDVEDDPKNIFETRDRGIFITSNYNYRWIRQVPIIEKTTAALGLKRRMIDMPLLLEEVQKVEAARVTCGEKPSTLVENGKNFTTHNVCIMKW